jgi:ethanolamine utilization protein EutQ (cupin superfamily)
VAFQDNIKKNRDAREALMPVRKKNTVQTDDSVNSNTKQETKDVIQTSNTHIEQEKVPEINNSNTTVQDVKVNLLSMYDKKTKKETVEDTHIRTTFLFRKDLSKRLDKLAKGKRGFKTMFMNEAIEALLNEMEK